MSKIWYADHDTPALAGILGAKNGGLGFSEWTAENPDMCPCQNGDLIFLHVDENQEQWIERISDTEGVQYVFVSRNAPSSLPNKNHLSSNAHLCEIPAGQLANDTRMGEFLKGWQRGLPRWELLLLEPYPENLVAQYLLDVASMELNRELQVDERLTEDARKEFEARGGRDSVAWERVEERRLAIEELFHELSEE